MHDPFDGYFPEYPAASLAAEQPNAQWLKAVDRYGNIYKIQNPYFWKIWEDDKKRQWVSTLKPQLILKAKDRQGAAGNRKKFNSEFQL